jgi:hypothetical protein
MKNRSIFLSLIVTLALPSCKKETANPSNAIASNADFSFTGDLNIGSSVSFKSNQPSDAKLSWKFSDLGPEWQREPIHKFSNQGDYTVSLLVNDQVVKQKTIHIAVGTERITGKTAWTKKSGCKWYVWEWTSGGCGSSYGKNEYTKDYPTQELNHTIESVDEKTMVLPADNKISALNQPLNISLTMSSNDKIQYGNADANLSYSISGNSVTIYRSSIVHDTTYWYSYTSK